MLRYFPFLCFLVCYFCSLNAQTAAQLDTQIVYLSKIPSSDQPNSAISELLDDLIVQAQKINYPGGISDAQCLKGHFLLEEGEYQLAISKYIECIGAARLQGDSSRVARGFINLCNAYSLLEQYTEAIESGLRAETLLEQEMGRLNADLALKDKNQVRLAEVKLNLSVAYGYFKDQQKALVFAQAAVLEHQKRASVRDGLLAGAYLNLGDWYTNFAKPDNHFLDSAYHYYKFALDLYQREQQVCAIPQVYINMAAVTMDQGFHRDAWALLEKANDANKTCDDVATAEALDWDITFQKAQWLMFEKKATEALPLFLAVYHANPDLFLQSDGAKLLAEAFDRNGLSDSAALYYKLALSRSDSTFEKKQINFNATTLQRLEERKNRQIELEALKAKVAESKLVWAFSALVLLSLLLVSLYFLLRNRQKIKNREFQLKVNDLLAKNETLFLDGQNEGKAARIDQIYGLLHSEYVPDLSNVKRGMEGLNKKMAAGLVPFEQGADLYNQLTDVTAKIRTLAQELSPDNRNTQYSISGDFLESLEQRIQIINRQNNVRVALHHNDILITERFALDLRRIVIDLLENALKYAHARHIDIYLHQTSEKLELTVRDDGRGMPASATGQGGGTGLKNIAQKVAKYHGSGPHISSSPGEGTSVVIRFSD